MEFLLEFSQVKTRLLVGNGLHCAHYLVHDEVKIVPEQVGEALREEIHEYLHVNWANSTIVPTVVQNESKLTFGYFVLGDEVLHGLHILLKGALVSEFEHVHDFRSEAWAVLFAQVVHDLRTLHFDLLWLDLVDGRVVLDNLAVDLEKQRVLQTDLLGKFLPLVRTSQISHQASAIHLHGSSSLPRMCRCLSLLQKKTWRAWFDFCIFIAFLRPSIYQL